MTDQNSELLRLLESEEILTGQLQGEVTELRQELEELRLKYNALLATASTHEELATKAAREGQLRAEEIRLLRVEIEQLKQQNIELKMKTQIEVESFQEQLRVRKEKQYQLLEKLQAQEEAKRQAEDQVAGMEEQLRGLHARNIDLETQNKVESRNKTNTEEANKELQLENTSLYNSNKELQNKIEKFNKEKLKMEMEARDSGEQLREMAEKVFQLLERLKLAELGKTKAMEALKKKEMDTISLQKKNARLIKESTEESKLRVKVEMDNKILQEQIRGLKKNNATLAQKSKEEALQKVKVIEERDQLEEKLKTMESRLSFLLNKVQADEETRVIQAEDRKKLEAQVLNLTEKCEELQHKLTEMGESNRIITQAMRLKQEELNEMMNKYDIVVKELQLKEQDNLPSANGNQKLTTNEKEDMNGGDDIENVRLNEGRGRFYVKAKSFGGGSLLLLSARKPSYKEWLDSHGVNEFLKKAQKTTRFRDIIIDKFSSVYGLLMVEEEEKNQLAEQISKQNVQLEHQQKKLNHMQDNLAIEEDAKRRMLLRYIHAVKEHAMANAASNEAQGITGSSGGILQLPESNLGDEEIHALAALLRNNFSIEEVNLRNNQVSDDGARALAAVLAGKNAIKLIDLRGNKISKAGIKNIAEALERNEKVKHVYVHAGGKIEALGISRWANPRNNNNNDMTSTNPDKPNQTGVETVCIVDIRDNKPESTNFQYMLDPASTTSIENFRPLQLTEGLPIPTNNQLTNSISTKLSKTPKKTLTKKSQSLNNLDPDKKFKSKEEQLMALKEMSWQGRSGGLDIDMSYDSSLKKKKVNSRTSLPPLTDEPPRLTSAPSGTGVRTYETFGLDPDNPEAILTGNYVEKSSDEVAQILKKTGGSKSKKKKMSETEKRLLTNSPFSQPVISRPSPSTTSSSPSPTSPSK